MGKTTKTGIVLVLFVIQCFFFPLQSTSFRSSIPEKSLKPLESSECLDSNYEAIDMQVVGNYAYVLDRNHGIMIFNRSLKRNFKSVSNYSNVENPVAFKIQGDNVYVLTESHLLSISMGDKKRLKLLKSCVIPSNCTDFALYGNYAYLSIGGNSPEIIVLNITNPRNISLIQSISFTNNAKPSKMVIWGKNLYFHNGNSTLDVYSISVPENPIKIREYHFDFPINCFVKWGNSLIVGGEKNLRLYNSTKIQDLDGINIPLISEIILNSTASNLKKFGNYIYATETKGIFCIDLRDLFDPKIIGYFGTYGECQSFTLSGGNAYYVDSIRGLTHLTISSPLIPPNKIYDIQDSSLLADIIVYDSSIAYLGGKEGLFSIFLPSCEPIAHDILDHYVWDSNVLDIVLEGNVLYVLLENSSLMLLNVSNPHKIQKISQFQNPCFKSAENMVKDGQIIYLSCKEFGLVVFKVTSNSEICELGSYTYSIENCSSFSLDGNRGYLVDLNKDSFLVLNLTFPSHIEKLAEYNIKAEIYDIKVQRDLVFVAAGEEGVILLEINDPTAITEKARYNRDISNVIRIFVQGNNFYALDNNLGNIMQDVDTMDYRFYSFNIFHFEKPSKTGYCSFEEKIVDVKICDDKAFLSKQDGGFHCLKILQTGSDDFDGDKLSYIEESWLYNTDPNKYNFLYKTSYIWLTVMLTALGIFLIVWGRRDFNKKAKLVHEKKLE